MAIYSVPGRSQVGARSRLDVSSDVVRVEGAVSLDASMRDGGPEAELELEKSDLVEVEFEDGFVLWTTLEQLLEDTEGVGLREGGRDQQLPRFYSAARSPAERGAVATTIVAIKKLGYDLPAGGAAFVAEKIEGQLAGSGDGELFRVGLEGTLSAVGELPAAAQPTLLLLHGTASSTANAFKGLFDHNAAVWQEIHASYKGLVYGFEHRTLTESPLENTITLLAALPPGAELHLLSHSRGGLVGDLLAHGGGPSPAFGDEDLDRELARAFKKPSKLYQQQRALYERLNALLEAKKPRVTRFVRVACPASGTSLAGGRLDRYLSALVYLSSLVPGVGPFLAGFGELVAAIAKERTKADSLPGLEAQMTKSAFIRLLHATQGELDSELTVLAGNSEGFVKNLANLLFWGANDMVVDTYSMYGGSARRTRKWYLEKNKEVIHTNYFLRGETALVVRDGLLGSGGTEFETGKPKKALRGHVDVGKPSDGATLPGVVLIPGIMGSHLKVVDSKRHKSERIWLDFSDLLKGRGRQLRIDNPTVEPDGVLARGYDDFRDYLAAQGIHVMPFAYDWRKSLTEAADGLAALLAQRLAASTAPVHLIAHSMGGLVASLLIRNHPATWEQVRERGGRLVQVGTPNQGSYVIPRILRCEERVLRLLAGIDFSHDATAWAALVAQFPGLLELSPTFDELDFFDPAAWKTIQAKALPDKGDLAAAKKVAETLKEQAEEGLGAAGALYVAGGPVKTPVKWDRDQERILWTERGDGRVSWESGIPAGTPTWYIRAKHGSLLAHKPSFAGLRELVLTGDTSLLGTEPPPASSVLREAVAEETAAFDREIDYLPSQEELEEAALGGEPGAVWLTSALPPTPPFNVSVVHGDLRYSQHPVLVGHYRGDRIVHAEAVLDACLDGALRSRQLLGLYPGEVGSAEVVLRRAPDGHGPPGALVIGLGNVGELTPGGLTKSITGALLRYAQVLRDCGEASVGIKLSSLLVGVGEAGLTMTAVLESFLLAVRQANRTLAQATSGAGQDLEGGTAVGAPAGAVSHVEFIELYQDTALEALHTLHYLRNRNGDFELGETLLRRDGGQVRPFASQAAGWWTRLSVRSVKPTDGDGSRATQGSPARSKFVRLKFIAYGERARAETVHVDVQRNIVDALIAEAIHHSALNEQIPQALFELLVPRELKASAADRRDLQLDLDPEAARFPWEILLDRASESTAPIGIGAGLLRQLRLDNVPPVVHPEDRRVLVIGDPPSKFPELDEAVAEAEHVAETFAARDWVVTRQIRRLSGPHGISAASVLQTLLTNDYRILHLAGHGLLSADSSVSGMVLGGGPEAESAALLTAAEIRQMRLTPELVFINCCHTGKIEQAPRYDQLAASIAAEFIRAGVKAVIAAGWAIDDAAARSFCRVFYDEMLGGSDLGVAVRRAREETFRDYRNSNTWGAYQCYGDPGFRLLADQGVRAAVKNTAATPRFVDPIELEIALENLQCRARVAKTATERDQLQGELERLRLTASFGSVAAGGASRSAVSDLVERFSTRPAILAAFARVHGELRDFPAAIFLIDAAERIDKTPITLTDLEQRENYRARWGEKQKDKGAVKQSIAALEEIVAKHGASAERHSLIAASLKRLAELEKSGSAVRLAIARMTEHYTEAAELRASNWYYPATNAALGVLLLGGPWKRGPKPKPLAKAIWDRAKGGTGAPNPFLDTTFTEYLDEIARTLRGGRFEEFWDASGEIDLAVVRALAKNALVQEALPIAQRYTSLMKTFGSEREVDSIHHHWNFAVTVAAKLAELKQATTPAQYQQMKKGLESLLEALR